MDLLLVALGAFFFAELNKTILPWPLQAWTKLALVVLGAVGAAVLLTEDVGDCAVLAAGGAGLASLVHKVHRTISAVGDAQQVTVLSTARPRRM